jgi:methyl-accepting chemotaxis protein
MGDKRIRRRIYFIEKPFQAKFILKFCGLVGAGGILTIILLYLWAKGTTTVAIVNSRVAVNTTADFLLPLFIQTVAITTVLVAIATVFVTLFISHKIAGPLYRFKRIMEALGDGNFLNEVRIRRNDQLQDLAKIFDQMIAKNRSRIQELKSELSAFKEKLNRISEDEVLGNKKTLLRELKSISDEVQKLVSYYKV